MTGRRGGGRGSSGGRAALVPPAPRGAPCSASPTQRGAAPEVPCPSAYKPCHVGFQRGAPLLPGTPGQDRDEGSERDGGLAPALSAVSPPGSLPSRTPILSSHR